MADPRFFSVRGPFTLAQLVDISGAELVAGDAERTVHDVAPLEAAGPEHLSFLDNKLYLEAFTASVAGACIVGAEYRERAPAGMAVLVAADPYRSYALAARAFYPEESEKGAIHETAIVDPSARLGEDVVVEARVVIGAGAEIGRACHIGVGTVIGPRVVIGDETSIGAGASISHAIIGARVLLHPGVRIGQRGFGFAMGREGHLKVPQLGRVLIEDDVEVGANSTIDRGSGPDTVIGAGSMIDNLVQIGHNVSLGKGCVIVAQAGVAGSSQLGDYVALGAQAGLVGHLKIGTGAQIAAQSGVMRDVPAGETVCGAPAVPLKQFFRQIAVVSRLAKQRGK